MSWKSFAVVTALLVGVPFLVPSAQASGCEATDRIDNSTAASAKTKLERAGYNDIRELKKSCDNFWHGKAVKDGVAVNVALSPQGEAITEGN